MSAHSRASTPRQRSREVHFTPGKSSGSPGKQQNGASSVLRIPNFQQIFDNEEYDVFDDDETPSFSEATVTIPNKVLDNMKIPLPTPGQLIMDSPVPWGKMNREKTEDSEIMDVKPEVYHAGSNSGIRSGLEKVTNTELRLEVVGWQEEEGQERRGETELSNGYESKLQNETDYDDEEPTRQQDDDGLDYYHADYDDGNEGSDYDDQKIEPGIWSEGSPTISSRGWLGPGGKDTLENFSPSPKSREGPQFHANSNDKGKGKTQGRNYSSDAQRLGMSFQVPKYIALGNTTY